MSDFDVVTLENLGKARVGCLTRVTPRAISARMRVVFIHGFLKRPVAYRRLIRFLTDVTQGSGEVYVYDFRSLRGEADPIARTLARELIRLLDSDPEGRLVLVGHSLGGALARRAILLLLEGWAAGREGPGQAKRTDLYDRVDRLVLLSSTNRGFEPKALWQGLLRRLFEFADWHAPIFDALRGSKWISSLRLEWIETFGGITISPDPSSDSEVDRGVVIPKPEGSHIPAHPKTIQIDGARDRVVRPDDSADMALFARSVRQFVVRGIVHVDFALEGLPEQVGPVEAGARTSVIPIDVGALESPELVVLDERESNHVRQLAELAGLISDAVSGGLDPPDQIEPRPGFGLPRAELPGSEATKSDLPGCAPGGWWAGCQAVAPTYDIVFMIHGIRDYGSWHPILGEALEREIRRATGYWKIVPIEYGYFSALQFLIPIQQRRLVKGFTDRYLNELTRALRAMIGLGVFSRVRLHAATHSNGCNVLAQAITGNDRLTFSRVFQAGCVLPCDFWGRASSQRAAFAVRNDCATLDWPVGVLCRNLGRLPLGAFRFLGPAGVIGFHGSVVQEAPAPPGPTRQFVRNNLSFVGDHGAALEPARMASIARYLIAGDLSTPVLDAHGPDRMIGPRVLLGAGLIAVVGGFVGLLWVLAWLGGLAAAGCGFAAVAATIFVIALLLNV
jgi:pimeloyl-ACP methyl ester carboxylesterase